MTDHIRMRRLLDEPIPDIASPTGVALQPLSAADPRALHRLLDLGYAEGGGSVAPFEQWWPALTGDEEFAADLVLIAADHEGIPVAVAQCWTSGFVKDLVVHPDWRDRGLGGWLLQTAFHAFRTRGLSAVDLKVETANPAAQRFYRRHGMVEVTA